MNEEKKLPDETLKEVSGGAFVSDSAGLERFERNNCMSCGYQLEPKCPYGSIVYAFQELGKNGICPAKKE